MPDDLPAPLKGAGKVGCGRNQYGWEKYSARLRQPLAGKALIAKTVAGIATEALASLLVRMQRARYGVLTWAAADLAFPHAELAIQSMCELVTALNAERALRRASARRHRRRPDRGASEQRGRPAFRCG